MLHEINVAVEDIGIGNDVVGCKRRHFRTGRGTGGADTAWDIITEIVLGDILDHAAVSGFAREGVVHAGEF